MAGTTLEMVSLAGVINPLTTIGTYLSHRELTFELTRFRRVAGAARLACTQQTHCGMHASIFSHTQTTTRAGSLVYAQVESGRDAAREEICGPTDYFQQF